MLALSQAPSSPSSGSARRVPVSIAAALSYQQLGPPASFRKYKSIVCRNSASSYTFAPAPGREVWVPSRVDQHERTRSTRSTRRRGGDRSRGTEESGCGASLDRRRRDGKVQPGCTGGCRRPRIHGKSLAMIGAQHSPVPVRYVFTLKVSLSVLFLARCFDFISLPSRRACVDLGRWRAKTVDCYRESKGEWFTGGGCARPGTRGSHAQTLKNASDSQKKVP